MREPGVRCALHADMVRSLQPHSAAAAVTADLPRVPSLTREVTGLPDAADRADREGNIAVAVNETEGCRPSGGKQDPQLTRASASNCSKGGDPIAAERDFAAAAAVVC